LIIAAFIPIAKAAMRIENALTENACASLVITLTSTELACLTSALLMLAAKQMTPTKNVSLVVAFAKRVSILTSLVDA